MSLEQTMVLATYHALLVLATVSTGSTRKQTPAITKQVLLRLSIVKEKGLL